MKKLFTLLLIVVASITVKAQCDASFGFQYDPMSGVTSLNGYANVNDSLAYPINYVWMFGDGSNGTGQYITHQFPPAGTFNVCLTITTANGCTSTYCDTISASNTSSCMADFSYFEDSTFQYSATYSFMNASIPDNGSTITSYLWNFGDGSTSSTQNPVHQFTASGTYQVCLYITTTSGCVSTSCANITVGNNPCQLYANMGIHSPTTIGGNDGFISTNVYGGTAPYAYLWNTGQTTSSIYNLYSGLYTLNIVDALGCQGTFTAYLYDPNDSTNVPIVDTLTTAVIDTCLSFVPDTFYVENVIVDPSGNIVTVTWAFQGSGLIMFFTVTYTYVYNGNTAILLSINCGTKAITTYTSYIHISSTTGITPVYGIDNEVMAYPVPFNDNLMLGYYSSGATTIRIFDATGKEVLVRQLENNGSTTTELNTSSLPKGIYILHIERNGIITHKKIVK